METRARQAKEADLAAATVAVAIDRSKLQVLQKSLADSQLETSQANEALLVLQRRAD